MPQLETLTLRKDTTLLKCRMPKLWSLTIKTPQAPFSIALVPNTVEILEIQAEEVRGDGKSIPFFSLTNLVDLTIEKTRVIDDLWPRLDLPNLEDLTVWNVEVVLGTRKSDRPILGDQGLFGLLPSLTCLTLGELKQPLIEDISTMHRLDALEIGNCSFAKDLISRLVDDGAVLPDLQKVYLDSHTCQSIEGFEWRCKSVRPTLEITISEY
jgi:hypothetical protein